MANPVLGLRVAPAYLKRLDRLITVDGDRTAVARVALERGLELLELEAAIGHVRAAPQRRMDVQTEVEMSKESKTAELALALLEELSAATDLPVSEAGNLSRMLAARATLESNYQAVVSGRTARARMQERRDALERERQAQEAIAQAGERDKRLVAEAETFRRMEAASREVARRSGETNE